MHLKWVVKQATLSGRVERRSWWLRCHFSFSSNIVGDVKILSPSTVGSRSCFIVYLSIPTLFLRKGCTRRRGGPYLQEPLFHFPFPFSIDAG